MLPTPLPPPLPLLRHTPPSTYHCLHCQAPMTLHLSLHLSAPTPEPANTLFGHLVCACTHIACAINANEMVLLDGGDAYVAESAEEDDLPRVLRVANPDPDRESDVDVDGEDGEDGDDRDDRDTRDEKEDVDRGLYSFLNDLEPDEDDPPRVLRCTNPDPPSSDEEDIGEDEDNEHPRILHVTNPDLDPDD